MAPRRMQLAILAALLLLAADAADAALTTGKCLALKRQAWGNRRKCEASEEAKRLKGKTPDLAKCQAKFQAALAKIDVKATKAAVACRYADNGDGTVTDYVTGLQWEQKTGALPNPPFGPLCILGDIHCVNDEYEWDAAVGFIDGSEDGATRSTCFYGYCDWRLPTITELVTLLLEPHPCSSNPCIDPIFGPTANVYWSSSSRPATVSGYAYVVRFSDGAVSYDFKTLDLSVRAVRSGL